MRRFILALFSLCLLICFKLSEPASALSCASPKSIKEELANSTVVFMGTALNPNAANYNVTVNFSAKTLWKGSTKDIEKGIIVSNMWKEIKAGEDYLIFASLRDGRVEANLCGNSKLLSEVSQEQTNDLGKGKLIIKSPVKNGNQLYWFVFSLFIIVVGSYVLIQFYHSRRKKK